MAIQPSLIKEKLLFSMNTTPECIFPVLTNCSPGKNQTEAQTAVHRATLATCLLLLLLVFGLGSYGNLIVFSSFFNPAFRKFRTHFDFMILNLSFCDLFICLVTAPMFGFVMFFDNGSGMSDTFCFAFHLTSTGFVIMSLKTVAVIAVHRLRMVLGQQTTHSSSSVCTLLLTVILWAVSFTLATLSAMTKYHSSKICVPLLGLINEDGKVILYTYVVDFTLCVGIVAISYAMIAQTLHKNAQVRRCPVITVVDSKRPDCFTPPEGSGPSLYRKQKGNTAPHVQTHLHAHSQSKNASTSNKKLEQTVNLSTVKDSKAVVTCIMILLSVVCCLPLGIALVHDALSSESSFLIYQFELCGLTLVFFRSGLNPFIYSRSNSGLRKKVAWCTQLLALLLCCKQKTRLKAVGDGSLVVNRNKSSHHDTNSAYILSPKPQKKLVDQACGPSNSKDVFTSVEYPQKAQSASTPINTRIEPYYSIYNSSISQEHSTPTSLQPKRHAFGSAQSYTEMYYHISKTSDFMPDCDSTSAKHIPVPSV
uniref:probable G-protein coupled receptor 75 n=1 Tax=Pristiophorus japonicus TaxID=55135 RepID=UPI00398EDCF4